MMSPAEILNNNLKYLAEHDSLISNIQFTFNAPEQSVSSWTVGTIHYHSARNPEREAERQIAALPQTEFLILFGAGLGYILEKTKRSVYSGILLIEPDTELLSALLSRISLRDLNLNLTIFVPATASTENFEEILPFLQGKNVDHIGIYRHRPAHEARPELYETLLGKFKSLLEKRRINQGTLIKFQSLWNRNYLMNLSTLTRAHSLNELLSGMKSLNCRTIVIAGAGPSLSQSFTDLRKYRQSFFLLSADTAFIPLAKAGIVPDITFSADPQWSNHHFVQHAEASKSVWLFDPVVNYSVTHQLSERGATTAAWESPFRLDAIYREKSGGRGEIAHGGSVSTNAFDFALQSGAKRIILVGQDLSFSNKQAHVKGASLEDAIYTRNSRTSTMELHNRRQMKALPPLRYSGIEGKSVYTNAKMQVFIEWFSHQAAKIKNENREVELINATVSGVMLPGFNHIPFKEISWEESCNKADLFSETDSHTADSNKRAATEMVHTLARQTEQLAGLYKKNAALATKAEREIQPEKKAKFFQEMTANDTQMKSYSQASEIISLNAQSLLLGITEEGKEIRQSEFYRTLAQSSATLLRQFIRAHSTLSRN